MKFYRGMMIVALGLVLPTLSYSQNSLAEAEVAPIVEITADQSAFFGFARIDAAIKDLQKIADKGGWPLVGKGVKKLVVGERDPRIPNLREHLKISGEWNGKKPKSEDADLFDPELGEALKKFQLSHGLNDDAVLGGKTLQALDVPAEARIKELERAKVLLTNLKLPNADRYILVNIPDFHLNVIDHDKPILTMRVITGKRGRSFQTPEFGEDMRYVVLSPRWNVPPSIATREMLPKIKADPSYLANRNFRVTQIVDGEVKAVDPTTIDWNVVDSAGFPYRFSRDPGADNDLGDVKFLFPNKYNVYLHDTSSRSLFVRDDRALSHGCVRLQKPIDLAELLLKDQNWDLAKIKAAIATRKERVVTLENPVPVRIVYVTAWVAEDGTPQFREDVYGRNPIK